MKAKHIEIDEMANNIQGIPNPTRGKENVPAKAKGWGSIKKKVLNFKKNPDTALDRKEKWLRAWRGSTNEDGSPSCLTRDMIPGTGGPSEPSELSEPSETGLILTLTLNPNHTSGFKVPQIRWRLEVHRMVTVWWRTKVRTKKCRRNQRWSTMISRIIMPMI